MVFGSGKGGTWIDTGSVTKEAKRINFPMGLLELIGFN